MTKGNVGSLLVLDPSKYKVASGSKEVTALSDDAVAGIITERGEMGGEAWPGARSLHRAGLSTTWPPCDGVSARHRTRIRAPALPAAATGRRGILQPRPQPFLLAQQPAC